MTEPVLRTNKAELTAYLCYLGFRPSRVGVNPNSERVFWEFESPPEVRVAVAAFWTCQAQVEPRGFDRWSRQVYRQVNDQLAIYRSEHSR